MIGSFNLMLMPTDLLSNGNLGLGESLVALVAGIAAVVFALLLLFSRRAVYSAMSLIGVMLCLAVIYTAQEAPFMGVVQVVVYTGAIMMLIIFVLMIVGIDASDSRHETLRGQRIIAGVCGVLLVGGLLSLLLSSVGTVTNLVQDNAQNLGLATDGSKSVILNGQDTNPVGLALALFAGHSFTLELVGTLLIVAALGAMTLTHRELNGTKKTQVQVAAEKMEIYEATGQGITMFPPPGVYAESNSAANPGLGPEDKPIEDAVPRVLLIRGQAHSLEEASPSTAIRKKNPVNVEVNRSTLPGMPGEAAPIPADPTANQIIVTQEEEK